MQPEIGIVIPVYNNQRALKELNERIAQSLEGIHYQVLYVNDCSTDQSLDLLQSLTSKDSAVAILNLPSNVGQQQATLSGLKAIKARKIVVLDADLQDKPELILSMYQACRDHASTVFIKRKGIYQTTGRMITSTLIKTLIQWISGLHRNAGSYYMFDEHIHASILSLAERVKRPYLSIVVAVSSPSIIHLTSQRGISAFGSNYTLKKRLHSGYAAISCAIASRFRV